MKALYKALVSISAGLDTLAVLIAKSGMALMVVCISIQIVARYIFSEPPAWTEELARYAMIWAGLAGATIACRRRMDPTLVDPTTLKRKSHRAFSRWLEAAAILTFTIPILWAAPAFLAQHADRSTDSLHLPSSLVVVIIPVCFVTIIFHTLVRLLTEHVEESRAPNPGNETF